MHSSALTPPMASCNPWNQIQNASQSLQERHGQAPGYSLALPSHRSPPCPFVSVPLASLRVPLPGTLFPETCVSRLPYFCQGTTRLSPYQQGCPQSPHRNSTSHSFRPCSLPGSPSSHRVSSLTPDATSQSLTDIACVCVWVSPHRRQAPSQDQESVWLVVSAP